MGTQFFFTAIGVLLVEHTLSWLCLTLSPSNLPDTVKHKAAHCKLFIVGEDEARFVRQISNPNDTIIPIHEENSIGEVKS